MKGGGPQLRAAGDPKKEAHVGILSRKTLLLRMVMMLIALLGSMLLVECTGSAGKIYGQFYYDGYLVANFGLGGFPSGTIYTDTNYQIQPGVGGHLIP